MSNKVGIRRLATGVPGLDNLLGGGLPEFSFNLIAAHPAVEKQRSLIRSCSRWQSRIIGRCSSRCLGEPALKMLRYQQQFPFFDISKVNNSIRFVNLSADLQDEDFDRVLSRIADEVKDFSPGLVFVDSFRSVVHSARRQDQGSNELQRFRAATGHANDELAGNDIFNRRVFAAESESSPVFTVADGILWLSQNLHRNSVVRKMQVIKMRGNPRRRVCIRSVSAMKGFRCSACDNQAGRRACVGNHGIPREDRVAMGTPGLDEMLGGGLRRGIRCSSSGHPAPERPY